MADALLSYMENNRSRMDYPRVPAAGLADQRHPVESTIKQFNRRRRGQKF